jgi:hypothetical protein
VICFHGVDSLKPAVKKLGEGKADLVVIVCSICGAKHGGSVPLIDLVQESMGLPPFTD